MAEQKFKVKAGFFDAIDNDRLYSAEEMNRPYKRVITNGIFATPRGTPSTDLQVLSANNGMNVIVKKGEGLIGDKWYENPTDLTITVSINTDIVPRVDSIIAQVDKLQNGRVGNIVYREGTPNSTPQPPAINTNENIIEMRLANIYVSPTARYIGQDGITDVRGSAECPWITSLIKQVDTSTLYEQYRAAYQKYYDDETEAFKAFMDSLTGDLTVNTTMLKYESHYVSKADGETVIPINIAPFNKDKDVLMVRVNRLFASEGTDYTISADSSSITLTKDIFANQNIDFLVLQSVIVADTETALQQVQSISNALTETNNLLDITQITSDTGSTKVNISSGEDLLAKFVAAGKGFHTMYVQSGATNVPATGAYRAIGHLTGDTAGWIMLFQANGSIYSNYFNEGVWRGWRVIHEVSPTALYQSANGVFPNENVAITPTKPLSQCEHGWTLIWTGYDDTAKAPRDLYTQTVNIPKRSYKGADWAGESMTIPLIYGYSNNDDSVLTCQKTFTLYNDRIVAGSTASTGKQRNMVLRAIYEY